MAGPPSIERDVGWDDYVQEGAKDGKPVGADITVTVDGRIGLGTEAPRSKVDLPGHGDADSGACINQVAIGTSVIEGVRYGNAHESVVAADSGGHLRSQSVNNYFVHTGGERDDCKVRVFVGKDGRVGMGPDPNHVCTPDTAVEVVGGHLTVRPKPGAVSAVTVRAPTEEGAWWNLASVSEDGRKLVIARGDLRSKACGDKTDWSGAALALTQAGDAGACRLDVSGDVVLDGALDVGKSAAVGGTLAVADDAVVGGAASIEHEARVGGWLDVAGASTLRGDLVVAGTATVGQDAHLRENLAVDKTLAVLGDFELGDGRTPSTMNIRGNLSLDGFIAAPQVQELERRCEALETECATLRHKLRLGTPRGMITMWSGNVANVPPGWVLCDGKSDTPDLRDRFVLGAGGDYGGDGHARDGTFEHTHGVTVHGHALSVDQLPPHSHRTATVPDPGKLPDYRAPVGNPAAHRAAQYAGDRSGARTKPTGEGREHAHDVTVPIVNHMPPFYVLAYIMKVAEDY